MPDVCTAEDQKPQACTHAAKKALTALAAVAAAIGLAVWLVPVGIVQRGGLLIGGEVLAIPLAAWAVGGVTWWMLTRNKY